MFSGIKYILGYADESTDSLNHSGEEEKAAGVAPAVGAAALNADVASVNVNDDSNETDCKDPMIEDDGQKNPPAENITLEDCVEDEQKQDDPQPNEDWSCDDDGSIDMDADVDETWEVIPPPCFTGSHITTSSEDDEADNKQPAGGKEAVETNDKVSTQHKELLPKGEAACRENALIEHPSFYIASTSCKDVLVAKEQGVGERDGKEVGSANDKQSSSCVSREAEKPMDWAKRIVLKKKVAPKKVVRLDTVPQVLNNGFEDAAWMSFNENVFADSDKSPEPPRGNYVLEPVLEQQPASTITEVVVADNKKQVARSSKLSYASVASAKIEDSASSSSFKMTPIKKKYTSSSSSSSSTTNNKNKSEASMNSVEKKAKTSAPVWTNTTKPLVEKKAWKNKFIVDDWDLDEQEDFDSDFDCMFEPVRKKKSTKNSNATKRQQQKKKVKEQQQQQQQQQQIQVQSVKVDVPEVIDEDIELALDMSISEPSSRSVSPCQAYDTPASVIELCENNSDDCSVELIYMRSISMDNSSIVEVTNENTMVSSKENDVDVDDDKNKANKKTVDEGTRKRVVQVRPIEPERRPGWQLKRQRSKRRPLGSSAQQNKQQNKSSKVSDGGNGKVEITATSSQSSSSSSSSSPSSRSTPTFIDRIGNSIVANLTNLTNGLVSSGALNSKSPIGNQSPLIESNEKMQQTVVANNKPGSTGVCNNSIGRKQLSKSFLDRQNICAQQSNRLRRPDRRLKMFTTPNGCSINRKVHASIH